MADISKIKIKGVVYSLKDIIARAGGSGGTGTGEDGFSPLIDVAQTTEGDVILTVTDKEGTETVTIPAGTKGDDGRDGGYYTPSVNDGWLTWKASEGGMPGVMSANIRGPQGEQGEQGPKGDTGTGFSISKTYSSVSAMNSGYATDGVPLYGFVLIDTGNVNDTDNAKLYVKGDSSYEYLTDLSGSQGIKGEPGDKGKDGTSVTHSWNGTTLSVTSASGTSSANLKGEKGDKGDTGAAGTNGTNGKDGYTPVKGTDYWTATDKEEIINTVLAEVGQGSSFGYIDENNNVVITQDLPVGTYTVRYETDDGNIELCSFEIKSTTKYTITNQLTNCTSNNSITEILENEKYTATITPKSNYQMDSITVKMGGTTLSGVVSGNTITINNVTGNIEIIAIASEIPQQAETFNVTFNGTNCTSNGASTATEGTTYTATITANSGYEMESITVTMGGATQSGVVSENKVTIQNVTGAIVITASAKAQVVNILTSAGYDVKLDQRWSHSTSGFTSGSGMISLVVPISDCLNKTIYFKGFPKDISANSKAPIWMSIKNNSRVATLSTTDTTGNVWKAKNLITVDATNGIYGIAINTTNFTGISASTVDGIAINMAYKSSGSIGTTMPSDAIMTIDNPNI